MGTAFVYETSNHRAQRFLALVLLASLLLLGTAIAAANMNIGERLHEGEHWYDGLIPDLAHDITPLKVLYISLIGGMIFFPIPSELAFYFSITQGHPALLCIALAVIGFVLGNVVNYYIGLKMHRQVSYLLSARTFFSVRRKVGKWGVYAVLLLNVLPAPSDVLTVGLGTIRYNAKKLFTLIAIGNIVKFTIIAAAASLLAGAL